MNKFISVIVLFVAGKAIAYSQGRQPGFSPQIDSLKVLGKNILGGKADSMRMASNEKFLSLMQETLGNPGSFEASFDSVTNVSVLSSPDNLLKVYTWTLPKVDMSAYRFFGFVQYYDAHKKKLNVARLEDASAMIETPQSEKVKPENWFGAVYYNIIESKKAGKKYYTLLGWKGNNRTTTKKLIDVVYLKKDSLMFGYPLFKSEKGYVNRLVFEYAAEAVMSLRYEPSRKMIVFDHLSDTGNNTAGPDGKYDAYKLVKGRWEFIKDVDVSKFSTK
jgi:hypothetical protein